LHTYVLVVHPTIVVEQLRKAGKIVDAKWMNAYRDIQLESKEKTFEERRKAAKSAENVIPIGGGKGHSKGIGQTPATSISREKTEQK